MDYLSSLSATLPEGQPQSSENPAAADATTTWEPTAPPAPTTQEALCSDRIERLASALAAFQGELVQPPLTHRRNGLYKHYATFSEVLSAAQPLLAAHGLSVTQMRCGDRLVSLLLHSSGQWLRSDAHSNADPCGEFCALTGVCCEAPEDDDDPEDE